MENKSRENDIRATAFAIFVGIIFICAGVFIFLTLIGFNPKDSLFFSTQLNSEVDHFLGKTGSIISSFLFYYTGRGAFVLAYFLIFSGFILTKRITPVKKAGNLLLCVMAMAS